jgi:phage terminase small subunit
MTEEKKYTKAELLKKLTPKEKKFCHEYIIDWNAARSARVAGYSEKTAKEIGCMNLTKVNIQQYIDFIKHDYEAECGISKTRQIKEYSKIAYSSIAHLHNTWIELKDFENLTDEQKESIESIDTKTEQKSVYDTESQSKEMIDVKYVKIKLYSKIAALERIDKLMGYNEPDKIDLSNSGERIKGITFDE